MEDYGLRLWTLKDVAKTSQDRLTCQYSTSAWTLDIARELQWHVETPARDIWDRKKKYEIMRLPARMKPNMVLMFSNDFQPLIGAITIFLALKDSFRQHECLEYVNTKIQAKW